ncbi:acyl-CoA Delta-9 desaturase-like [Bicyclus anynana]|uniref:Acyl-CoA Delta-9 desaturase-like n=1 Tax=Bicyclus anynana TaxID=110368 RepID=A0A6J1MJ49_BICAN|nr:acyl-CoA Delta-9 desaturase-like [Bicyclus anynana]
MGPLQKTDASVIYERSLNDNEELTPQIINSTKTERRELDIVWRNVIIYTLLHLGGIYGGFLFVTQAKWATRIFAFMLYVASGLGITAGVHRLWSHKAYKAKLPLRILLVAFNTIAYQDSIIHWARDHRVHHKHTETDADPHNATRGFFFSHVGWLLVKKHPEIKAKGQAIDVSDLWADPLLRFQKNYYLFLMPLACFILPTYIPTVWGESLKNAFFVSAIFRYVYVLNVTWLINSAAHMFGTKPYDKDIYAVETRPVALVTLGEGFHNFHHTFPWDSKTSELGNYALSFTNIFLEAMAKIGWAYDFRTVPRDVVLKTAKKSGDGSHPEF